MANGTHCELPSLNGYFKNNKHFLKLLLQTPPVIPALLRNYSQIYKTSFFSPLNANGIWEWGRSMAFPSDNVFDRSEVGMAQWSGIVFMWPSAQENLSQQNRYAMESKRCEIYHMCVYTPNVFLDK